MYKAANELEIIILNPGTKNIISIYLLPTTTSIIP